MLITQVFLRFGILNIRYMCTFLGIEMTGHTAFIIFAVLSVISAVSMISGCIMMNYYEKKWKMDLALLGCYIAFFGGIGFIVFSLLGGCFKQYV